MGTPPRSPPGLRASLLLHRNLGRRIQGYLPRFTATRYNFAMSCTVEDIAEHIGDAHQEWAKHGHQKGRQIWSASCLVMDRGLKCQICCTRAQWCLNVTTVRRAHVEVVRMLDVVSRNLTDNTPEATLTVSKTDSPTAMASPSKPIACCAPYMPRLRPGSMAYVQV